MKIIREWVYQCWLYDAHRKFRNIQSYISHSKKILELGSGPGSLWQVLSEKGFDVEGIDIKAIHIREKFRPLIYDGNKLPFSDNSFDIVLISTVLHHCLSPELLLQEAKRVGKRVIVIEDIPFGKWHLMILKWTDALVNLQFRNHPFNFRSDLQWRKTFNELDLRCLHSCKFSVSFFFRQAVYMLE